VIKIINNKGNELLLIINDIIDISKIEAGDIKIFPAEIQINSFLREIFDSLNEEKNLMNKENIQLRLNISNEYNPVLHSDPARLRQIIYNLFTNALKFTNEGYVEIGYEFLDNKRIKFYVTDTGVGIPEDKQDIVFDRFRQVDESISPQHGGTGLGLAISKNLVELLGGEISLQSHPKHGSTFWFTLPVIKKVKEKKTIETDDKKKRKAETDIIDLSGHSILIAEDDASNYLFIESFLRRAKARIIWAKDGIQALETMKEDQDIHIVLMDLRMPKMNGIEATREIRKIRKSVPIIALTAYAFANDRQKALNAGCNAYLSKPVKLDELSDVIIRLLNEK